MKIIATIEARMASSRLPGKSIAQILGKPVLEHIVDRLRRAPSIEQIVVATTDHPQDDAIEAVARRLGVGYFRGSEDDVLDRVVRAAQSVNGDVIFQYGADCPFADPELTEQLLQIYRKGSWDFVANTLKLTYPLGIVGAVVSTATLEQVRQLTKDSQDREDVTRYIWEHPERYRLYNLVAPPSLHHPEMRVTVDYPEDLEVVTSIFEAFYPIDPTFTTYDIVRFLASRPDLVARNRNMVQRSAPFLLRTGRA